MLNVFTNNTISSELFISVKGAFNLFNGVNYFNSKPNSLPFEMAGTPSSIQTGIGAPNK